METTLDSGIDEEEEYHDPMTMEPGPGAIDDYRDNNPSSGTTEPDPRDSLSLGLIPNISLKENMRSWGFRSNDYTDMR